MDKFKIKNLIENYPKKVTDLRKDLKDYIEACTTNYPKDWTLFQKVYHEIYLESSCKAVLCPVCNTTPLRFTGLRTGYSKTCSASCRNRSPEFLRKYKDACLKKYGTEFASQSSEFRDNVKSTNMSKYGVDNPFKSEQVRKKHRQTCMEKYGVDNPAKTSEVIDKIKQSRIASGDWISDRSELEIYRLAVKKISAKSYHDHYYKINPNNLPRSRYRYHLDHIFSVEEGFKQGIPAEIIGHWTNLQMLWHLDNSIKNTKCHKTLAQLLEDYKKENPN